MIIFWHFTIKKASHSFRAFCVIIELTLRKHIKEIAPIKFDFLPWQAEEISLMSCAMKRDLSLKKSLVFSIRASCTFENAPMPAVLRQEKMHPALASLHTLKPEREAGAR